MQGYDRHGETYRQTVGFAVMARIGDVDVLR